MLDYDAKQFQTNPAYWTMDQLFASIHWICLICTSIGLTQLNTHTSSSFFPSTTIPIAGWLMWMSTVLLAREQQRTPLLNKLVQYWNAEWKVLHARSIVEVLGCSLVGTFATWGAMVDGLSIHAFPQSSHATSMTLFVCVHAIQAIIAWATIVRLLMPLPSEVRSVVSFLVMNTRIAMLGVGIGSLAAYFYAQAQHIYNVSIINRWTLSTIFVSFVSILLSITGLIVLYRQSRKGWKWLFGTLLCICCAWITLLTGIFIAEQTFDLNSLKGNCESLLSSMSQDTILKWFSCDKYQSVTSELPNCTDHLSVQWEQPEDTLYACLNTDVCCPKLLSAAMRIRWVLYSGMLVFSFELAAFTIQTFLIMVGVQSEATMAKLFKAKSDCLPSHQGPTMRKIGCLLFIFECLLFTTLLISYPNNHYAHRPLPNIVPLRAQSQALTAYTPIPFMCQPIITNTSTPELYSQPYSRWYSYDGGWWDKHLQRFVFTPFVEANEKYFFCSACWTQPSTIFHCTNHTCTSSILPPIWNGSIQTVTVSQVHWNGWPYAYRQQQQKECSELDKYETIGSKIHAIPNDTTNQLYFTLFSYRGQSHVLPIWVKSNASIIRMSTNDHVSGCAEECTTDIRCDFQNGGCSPHQQCQDVNGTVACLPNCTVDWMQFISSQGCVPIEKCQYNNGGCSTLRTCVQSHPSDNVVCGPCPLGWEESGPLHCDVQNQCAVENGGCDTLQLCIQTYDGQTLCSSCPEGYFTTGNRCVLKPVCHTCAECSVGYQKILGECSDINECMINHGGCSATRQCVNTIGSWYCGMCIKDYTFNGTDCILSNPSPDKHACPVGYLLDVASKNCIDVDECQQHPCMEAYRCVNYAGFFSCVEPIESMQNQSVCAIPCREERFCPQECTCPQWFSRDARGYCVRSAACLSNLCNQGLACQNGTCLSTCLDSIGFQYNESSKACNDRQECLMNVCPGRSCYETNGSYICGSDCLEGFQLDINTQECTDINECTNQACFPFLCINEPGSFTCSDHDCIIGYQYNNGSCENINECEQNATICGHERCIDLPGTYACETCPDGYMEHGTDLTACLDIQVCALTHGGCDPMSSCVDLPGWNVSCGPCPSGLQKVFNTNQCVWVSPCLTDPFMCDIAYQTCISDPITQTANCTDCPSGRRYQPLTRTCEPVNECEESQPCHPLRQCIDTAESYICLPCPSNYTVDTDGWSCADIPECTLHIDKCHRYRPCIEEIGGYRCAPQCNQPDWIPIGDTLCAYMPDPCAYSPCSQTNRLCSKQDPNNWSGLSYVQLLQHLDEFIEVNRSLVYLQNELQLDLDLMGNVVQLISLYNQSIFVQRIGQQIVHEQFSHRLIMLSNHNSIMSPVLSISGNTTVPTVLEIRQGWTNPISESEYICTECLPGFVMQTDGTCQLSTICSWTDNQQWNCSTEAYDYCQGDPCDAAFCESLPELQTFRCSPCPFGYETYGFENGTQRCILQDMCKSQVHCSNCSSGVGTWICHKCNEGYALIHNFCVNVNECLDRNGDCGSLRSCIDKDGNWECGSCIVEGDGIDPMTCLDINECTHQNGGCSGVCINTYGSYTCDRCPAGFVGRLPFGCVDIDECAQHRCSPLTVCTNTPGRFVCTPCPNGTQEEWIGEIQICHNINECDPPFHSCQSQNLVCHDLFPGFICGPECLHKNWTIHPNTCQPMSDLCALGMCDSSWFQCKSNHCVGRCPKGMVSMTMESEHSSITTCIIEFPCVVNNGGCSTYQTCSVVNGTHITCSDCLTPGYKRHPHISTECIDINECVEQPGLACPPNVQCENLDGSYRCLPACTNENYEFRNGRCYIRSCGERRLNATVASLTICLDACQVGWTGFPSCDQDIDECALGLCPVGFTCVNTLGSFSCNASSICNVGFQWSEGKCVDQNECEDPFACPALRQCINRIGGFACGPCPIGYRLVQNGSCVDINECAEHLLRCSTTCVNLPGTAHCEPCPLDWLGFANVFWNGTEWIGGCIPKIAIECKPNVSTHECTLSVQTNNSLTNVFYTECKQRCDLRFQTCTNTSTICTPCPFGTILMNQTCVPTLEDLNTNQPPFPINTIQPYTNASCSPGFMLVESKNCVPVPYCLYHTCPIGTNCTPSGCTDCASGYRLVGNTCQDINECLEDPCQTQPNRTCVNELGSYRCEPPVLCPLGFVSMNQSCVPVQCNCSSNEECYPITNECVPPILDPINVCSVCPFSCSGFGTSTWKCMVTLTPVPEATPQQPLPCENCPPSYQCQNEICVIMNITCNTGMKWDMQEELCVDMNECESNNGGCEQLCTNTQGASICTCTEGFVQDKYACIDILECLTNNGGCDPLQTCIEQSGSYACSECPFGYIRSSAPSNLTSTCIGINPCLEENGQCDPFTECVFDETLMSRRWCSDCPTGMSGSGYTTCIPNERHVEQVTFEWTCYGDVEEEQQFDHYLVPVSQSHFLNPQPVLIWNVTAICSQAHLQRASFQLDECLALFTFQADRMLLRPMDASRALVRCPGQSETILSWSILSLRNPPLLGWNLHQAEGEPVFIHVFIYDVHQHKWICTFFRSNQSCKHGGQANMWRDGHAMTISTISTQWLYVFAIEYNGVPNHSLAYWSRVVANQWQIEQPVQITTRFSIMTCTQDGIERVLPLPISVQSIAALRESTLRACL